MLHNVTYHCGGLNFLCENNLIFNFDLKFLSLYLSYTTTSRLVNYYYERLHKGQKAVVIETSDQNFSAVSSVSSTDTARWRGQPVYQTAKIFFLRRGDVP